MPLGRQVLSGKPLIAAGQRDRAVTIQSRPTADTASASGFPGETWTTLVSREWMARLDLRADEQSSSNQLSASAETQWHMAYRSDMDPELVDVPKLRRLVYQGRVFDIVTSTQIGFREGIELTTLASTRRS